MTTSSTTGLWRQVPIQDAKPYERVVLGETFDVVQVRRRFEELGDTTFRFGLNHGDLALWNTLVEPNGKVNLLDWGSAEAHIVPHFDLLHVIRHHLIDGTPSVEEMTAFREGYGLSWEAHERLKPELDRLFLLLSFDKLRWAIDRNPARIEEYIGRAKMAVKSTLAKA